jgi:hypothetical protein
MWEPRHLTTLWASTACYRDSFTLPHCHLWADCREDVGASTSHNPMGLPRPVTGRASPLNINRHPVSTRNGQGCLNEAVSSSHYIRVNHRLIGKLERIWKEAFVGWSRHYPGILPNYKTKHNLEELFAASWKRIEPCLITNNPILLNTEIV